MKSSDKRSVNKAIEVIKWILFWLLILFLVLQVIIIFLIPDADSNKNRLPFMIYEVTSDSMYPKLKAGDGVIDIREAFEDLEKGDLITFMESGEVITHEITGVNSDNTVYTSGINPVMQDAPVTEDDYIGKVIIKLPGLSGFLAMTKGPVRKIIWVLLIVFVLFAPEAIFKLSEKNKNR